MLRAKPLHFGSTFCVKLGHMKVRSVQLPPQLKPFHRPVPPKQTTNHSSTNASLDHTTSQPLKTRDLVETGSVKTQKTRGSNAGVHVGGVKDAREESWRDEKSEPESTPEPVPEPEPAPRAPRTKGKRVIIEDSDDEPVDGDKVNSDDNVDTSMGRLFDDMVPEQLPVRCRSRAPKG